ncbi:NADH-quinone oxidoreductase subunit NuoE [Blochmannia endosymbiont of Camponotus modoc]|uniref:NADH-quinone oxidoreductase subunit NuoE n=1 Tax=Blochmannia endosymbiont of Camponotus modoc TaxID=2945587 RepID=UPI0020244DC6|nr:NADH-quinone oxidoreductase subunit NuoE [Blochmannia endosymbiont of Camponotus modoc]URJ31652.1 NADH-quinone oxidoreductase subunit NuoE [Blochmannia endosymbiont of Camponotus modoc]
MSNIKINDTSTGLTSNGFFQLSQEEYNAIQEECTHYEDMRSVSIEALKIIQKNHGWVPDEAIILVAKILCISAADLEGVATFYNQIFRQPVGRHIIRYCDSAVCYLVGCEKIKNTLTYLLNITVGSTTSDNRFTLLPTCCLGICDKAPVIMIDKDIYPCIVPEKITKLLGQYL